MGGKSVNVDSKSHQNKCVDTYQLADDDWISRLPDDILVSILSSLPLKEAARTGILSSRWENLWKHTSCLDCDADGALHKIAKHRSQIPVLTTERRKYISWVSKVIRSHKGLALKEVKICFDLDDSARKAINCWLRHVFERRVERLELDLSVEGDLGRGENVFPIKQFTLHQAPRCFDFRSLRWLRFKSVRVTDQDVHFFLRSCPLLEHLAVTFSYKIKNLNICGALALKHLEINWCGRVKSIKVSAPNLTSLKVSNIERLLLENVPKLAEVHVVACILPVYMRELVPILHCCLSQLEVLSVNLHLRWDLFLQEMEYVEECNFPVLAKLKKLEIQFPARRDRNMITLTSLLRAAPNCQEFVITTTWNEMLRIDKNCVKDDTHSPYQHLKVVKFLGYYGRSSDVELVWYLLGKSVVLEKLIIDPRYQRNFPHKPFNPTLVDLESTPMDESDAVSTARNCAKQQLQGKVPQHIQLLIL